MVLSVEGAPYLYEKEELIPPEDYVRVDYRELYEFVKEIFVKTGTREEYAGVVADVLVKADLMGISSHGVQRVQRYVGGIRTGNIDVDAEPQVVKEYGAIAVVDANKGFGQVAGVYAMKLAIEKARDYGVSMVLVRNSNHFGIAGYYSLLAVEKGFIGITLTNSVNLVAYTHTVDKILGTNPIAVAIPRKTPPPILFDAATSVVPVGKIQLYAKQGKKIPPGWVIDKNGEVLEGDASQIYTKIKTGESTLLPLGGLGEKYGGHKGTGLSFIVDILSGVLSGAAWGIHVGYTIGDRPSNVGHAFTAINIEAFMDRDEFYKRVEKYVAEIKSARKHPKAERIWIPGEKAWYTMQTRLKIGIPLHKRVYSDLLDIAHRVGCRKKLSIKKVRFTS